MSDIELSMSMNAEIIRDLDMLYNMAVVKAIAITILCIVALWAVVHIVRNTKRQDRILALCEDILELSGDRKETAKNIVAGTIEQKTEEIKTELQQIPMQTAKIVQQDVIAKAISDSGTLQKGGQPPRG